MASTISFPVIASLLVAQVAPAQQVPGKSAQPAPPPDRASGIALDIRIASRAPALVAAVAEVGQPEMVTLRGQETVKQVIERRCGIAEAAYIAAFLRENATAKAALDAAALDLPAPGKGYSFPYCLPYRPEVVPLAGSVGHVYASKGLPLDSRAVEMLTTRGTSIKGRALSTLNVGGDPSDVASIASANQGFDATEYARRFARDNPLFKSARKDPGLPLAVAPEVKAGTLPLRNGETADSATARLVEASGEDGGGELSVEPAVVASLIGDMPLTKEQCPGADDNPDWPFPRHALGDALAANDRARGRKPPPIRTVLVLDTGYLSEIGEEAVPQSLLGVMRSFDGESLPTYVGINAARRINSPRPPSGLEHAEHGSEVAATLLGGTFLSDRVAMRVPKVVFASIAQRAGGGAFLDVGAINRAFLSAVDSDVQIINASIAASTDRDTFLAAVKSTTNRTLLVTAAGNVSGPPQAFSGLNPTWPGSLGGNPAGSAPTVVVSVGAHGPDGRVLDFSRTGYRQVDLLAPGCRVPTWVLDPTSGKPNRDYRSGTSFAAPLVSMVAAQLSGEGLKATAIKDRLIISVDMDERLRNVAWSGGRLNISKALSIFREMVTYSKEGSVRTITGRLTNLNDLATICGQDVPLAEIRKLARSQDPANPAAAKWRGWQRYVWPNNSSFIDRLPECDVANAPAGVLKIRLEDGTDEPVPLSSVVDYVASYR